MAITPEIAAQVLLSRKEERQSLEAWCRHNGDIPALHHRLIIKEVEGVIHNLFRALERGSVVPSECLNLMIMMPPGTAKSTYVSKNTPPWVLGQWQYLKKRIEAAGRTPVPLEVLACSHSSDFAEKWGKAARNLIQGNETWLGYEIRKDSASAGEWALTNGCAYKAAGVGKGIAGIRAHVGIIDDFCGLEEDAHSANFNDKVWTWYLSDFKKRLQPIAAQIIIFNHRDEADLGGRLMSTEAARWRIVRLRLLIEDEDQAAADPLGRSVGEHIWPEYFTCEQVADRMKDPGASGIEQQEPSPKQGAHFHREHLCGYEASELDRIVKTGTAYGASDHAVRTNQRNDNSCLGIGYFSKGILYIHPDLKWGRLDSLAQIKAMLKFSADHHPTKWWAEKENISGAIGPILKQQMLDESNWMSVTEVSHKNKDLMARTQSAHAMCTLGLVKFPKWTEWYQRAERELLVFPNGGSVVHDDFVSFLAHLCRGIFSMTSPNVKAREDRTEDEIVDAINSAGMNITMKNVREQLKKDKRNERMLSYR